ncbi:hypothetical protein L3V82_08580 [Thiotrichales bacterium 19S3-7]|nr:hypothetical protein [Thiotrichales bacterium 19S3-7]MCF6802163.1 hypothetical protein [Thiotrichales bacterium 19S3-11]
MSIPVLDFSCLDSHKPNYQLLARSFYDAYSTLGFASIINHGVSHKLIDQLFQQMAAFHQLPRSVKMKYKYAQYLRGYLPLNISTLKTSTLANVTKPNQSESFMILNEAMTEKEQHELDQTPLGGRQIWPEELPEFKQVAQNYYAELLALSQHLVKILALALNLPIDYFKPYFTQPNIFFRMLFYPPRPVDTPNDVYGSAPHSDYGCFTLLLQDTTGGLQVKDKNDTWINVITDQYTFILNTGDMIERWSNGILKSTPHRVINKSNNKPRYSVPFFYNCNLDTSVKPLDSCISSKHPAQFEPVNYGDVLTHKILSHYTFSE